MRHSNRPWHAHEIRPEVTKAHKIRPEVNKAHEIGYSWNDVPIVIFTSKKLFGNFNVRNELIYVWFVSIDLVEWFVSIDLVGVLRVSIAHFW